MTHFDIDTKCMLTDNPNQLSATLSERWNIWGPNGGYLSAIALRAIEAFADGLVPISLHTQYLRVAKFSEVGLNIRELRKGRSVANYEVVMVQGGKDIIRTNIILGKEHAGLNHDCVNTPSEIDTLDSLPTFERSGDMSPFWDNFNLKAVNWGDKTSGEEATSKTWFEFKGIADYQNLFLDYARSVVLIDTMLWPAAHSMYDKDIDFVAPSLDLYIKFHRSSPHSEWLFCNAISPLADRGLLTGNAEIFDKNGMLLASGGSQMYCQKLSEK